MYLYAELWSTKPEWEALSVEEQQEFLARVGPSVQKLQDAGVEVVGFEIQDADVPYASPHRYLAVWKMPDLSLCERLEEAVESAGWHRYFDQVNLRGPLMPPPEALGDMVG